LTVGDILMIHIATVHWEDDRWIGVQRDYLRRHIREPFRVYAWLNGVPGDHRGEFHYTCVEPVREHAVKLNLLADVIYLDSDRDRDLLVFLDGDAFPVGDAVAFARRKLAEYPLVAVQRRENNGDVQPHPCFCVTTVGFWKRIKGDWKQGHTWSDSRGEPTTDVGGNLLGILEWCGEAWYPMRRSNEVDLHPLWFGVYEGVVYHHGGGFREPLSRHDLGALRGGWWRRWDGPVGRAVERLAIFPRSWRRSRRRQVIRRNQQLSDRVYEGIVRDPLFYRAFLKGSTGCQGLE
jgi:hypothetical protein